MFKGSNNVALGYDEGSILIKVCQLFHIYALYCNQCITCTSVTVVCKGDTAPLS